MRKKITSSHSGHMGKRILALFLAILSVLGLFVQAFAAPAAPPEPPELPGFLEFTVTPIVGAPKGEPGSKRGETHTSSFAGTIMTDKKTGNVIKSDRTIYGLEIYAQYRLGMGLGITNEHNKAIRLDYITSKNGTGEIPWEKAIPLANSLDGKHIQHYEPIDVERSSDMLYAFRAVVYDPDTGEELHSAVISVDIKRTIMATSGTRYRRIGMQIRAVNGVPIGKTDYVKHKGGMAPVPNTAGILADGGQWGTYTSSFDGQTYDSCYFDVNLGNEIGAASIQNLDEVYEYLYEKILTNEKIKQTIRGDAATITLQGPAYLQAHHYNAATDTTSKEKRYNMAYYTPLDKNKTMSGGPSINDYVSWPKGLKNGDFCRMRFVEFVIPLKNPGLVTVNCYDEDNPDKLLQSQVIEAPKFEKVEDINAWSSQVYDTFDTHVDAFLKQYADGDFNAAKMMDPNLLYNYEEYKVYASTLKFDPATKTVISTGGSGTPYDCIEDMIPLRRTMLQNMKNTGVDKPYSTVTVTAPKIENYDFDFGVGQDALSIMHLGCPVTLSQKTTGSASSESVDVMVSQDFTHAVMNLYYKSTREGEYTVKVRYNGTIIEDLTKTYPGAVGEIIEKHEVDTSVVPSEWPIQNIENVPLEIQDDSSKNIIIINCGDKFTYKVEYFLNGVFKEQEVHAAEGGATINKDNLPLKGFPGYKLEKISGLPLTIIDNNGVIRVYYISDRTRPASPDVNAKLYKDQYRTPIKVSKSGYGVWGTFTVDFSDLANQKVTPRWTENGGCSASSRSKMVNRYSNFKVTATATYYEGLPFNQQTGQNVNGRKITVPLVKDTRASTATKWVFHFPKNIHNKTGLPKAYIPINWKDGKNWTVNFDATITCDEYQWTTGTSTTSCGRSHGGGRYDTGSKDDKGNPIYGYYPTWSHSYTIHPLKELPKVKRTFHEDGSASILIDGSMYEDDFTGGRR